MTPDKEKGMIVVLRVKSLQGNGIETIGSGSEEVGGGSA